jgi:hypothetical protein
MPPPDHARAMLKFADGMALPTRIRPVSSIAEVLRRGVGSRCNESTLLPGGAKRYA